MDKALFDGGPVRQQNALAARPRRPSTVRRIENLQRLVAALAARDMNYLAAAAFLQCSPSAARQYLHQLADAGMVALCPGTGNYGVRGAAAAPWEAGAPVRRDPLVAALFGNAAPS